MSKNHERRWLVIIFLTYLLLAVGYSLLMPIWEAPDEPAHYHLAWYFERIGQYPTLLQNGEANQPRAYYYFAARVIHELDKINPRLSDYFLPYEYIYNIRVPVRRFDWNDGNYRFLLGVYLLRWINIILGALALWLMWLALRFIVPDKPYLRIAALALAALTPQFDHTMSSVSNDPLGTLAGALLIYLAIRLVVKGSQPLALLSIPLAIILPLNTKLTVVPISAALLVAIGWQELARLRSKKHMLFLGLTVLSVPIILFLLFPTQAQKALTDLQWRLTGQRPDSFKVSYLAFIFAQIVWTYWGRVGWLAVGMHPIIIVILTVLGAAGALLNARYLKRTGSQHPQFKAWMMTWLIALLMLAAVFRNGLSTSASQGRFLFPAIGVLSLLMVSGWYERAPERIQRHLPLIVFVMMLLCNLVLWTFGVIPDYYQPFLG